MRAVVQRVENCRVEAYDEIQGEIASGLLVYLGITHQDGAADINYISDKIVNLRIFEDREGKMNLSLKEKPECGILVLSQFTLYGDTRKGRRPSYSKAAPAQTGRSLYNKFLKQLEILGHPPQSGVFGASMRVTYTNLGPVTLLLDSEKIF